MRALGAADAAEGAVTLFFIEEALGIHGWTGALLLAHLLIRSFAWGADYIAAAGDGVGSGAIGRQWLCCHALCAVQCREQARRRAG